jgi:hypothetical protein
MGRNGKSRVSRACLVVCIAAGGSVGELHSQTITGTIVEGRSARPAVGVEVLASVGGADTGRTFSDDNGAFTMRLDDSAAARSSGRETVAITLTFRRLGFETRDTVLELRRGDEVSLTVSLGDTVVELDPIAVVVRRGRLDPRASVPGLYARRATLPRVGSNRVFVRGDPEFESVSSVGQLLDRWLQIGSIPRNRCVVWFVNGIAQWSGPARSPPVDEAAIYVRGMSPTSLEGLEYYRDFISAPAEYHAKGCWGAGSHYSIIAVWFRSSADEP